MGCSDGSRKLVEGHAEPVADGTLDGEFVVAAAQVLGEGVPGSQGGGPVAFQPAHRPQPRFQPAVIGLDRIVRIPLGDVQCRRNRLVEDPRVSRCPVGGDLGWDRAERSMRVKNRRAAARSRRADSRTSMTWPC